MYVHGKQPEDVRYQNLRTNQSFSREHRPKQIGATDLSDSNASQKICILGHRRLGCHFFGTWMRILSDKSQKPGKMVRSYTWASRVWARLKGALYWIHSQNSALVSWPIRHVTYTNRSPLLTAYTATHNIIPQVEHEIKVSIQIFVVCTLGYIIGSGPTVLDAHSGR